MPQGGRDLIVTQIPDHTTSFFCFLLRKNRRQRKLLASTTTTTTTTAAGAPRFPKIQKQNHEIATAAVGTAELLYDGVSSDEMGRYRCSDDPTGDSEDVCEVAATSGTLGPLYSRGLAQCGCCSVSLYRCSQCSFWIKYCLFVINFFVLVGAICMLIVGCWARLQSARLAWVDELLLDPAFFVLIVSVVMMAVSLFGCLGSLRENVCFLKTFCIVTALVFTLEVISGTCATLIVDYVRDRLTQYLMCAVQQYQDDAVYKETIDVIQQQFRCCGVSSYNDWEMNVYFNCSSRAQSRCGVPRSCCKVTSTNSQCGYLTRIEGELYAAHTIHTFGCMDQLITIYKDHIIVIGFIAFSVGIVEVFSLLLAHSLIREIQEARKLYSQHAHLTLSLVGQKRYDSIVMSSTCNGAARCDTSLVEEDTCDTGVLCATTKQSVCDVVQYDMCSVMRTDSTCVSDSSDNSKPDSDSSISCGSASQTDTGYSSSGCAEAADDCCVADVGQRS